MNRQRRLEAIARKRAFLDSQIKMLASTEIRVPNIIRNRAIKSPHSRLATMLQNTSKEGLFNQSVSQTMMSQAVTIRQSEELKEEVLVAVLNSNDNEDNVAPPNESVVGQNEMNGESLPIALSSEEIAKILTGSGATEQLSLPLETIQADDGTVMVVLDGNNFSEADILNALSIGREEVGSGTLQEALPAAESSKEEGFTESEESYVIVQTPEGDIIVPSSNLNTQFHTQTESTDENIIQIIATESEAIEQFITSSNSSKLSNASDASPFKKCGPKISSMQSKPLQIKSSVESNAVKRQINKGVSVANKSTNSFARSKMYLKKGTYVDHKITSNVMSRNDENNGVVMNVGVSCIADNEKPRPFRFELPEQEDHLNGLIDCFISVPVPIQIGSLKNENEKDIKEKKEIKNYSQPQPENNYSVSMTDVGSSNDNKETGTDTSKNELLSSVEQTIEAELPAYILKNQPIESCDSFLQCGQCLRIFSKLSMQNHLEQCVSHNHSLASSVSSQVYKQNENYSFVGKNPLETGHTAEEKLVIKSVSSLNASAKNLNILKEDISSQSMCEQEASPVLILDSNPSLTSETKNLVGFCVQLMDECETDVSPSKKQKNISNSNYADNFVGSANEFVAFENSKQFDSSSKGTESSMVNITQESTESSDVGRRTLNKASAKANMSNGTDIECNEVNSASHNEKYSESENGNGNAMPSARIRSRNDRVKAMGTNSKSEQELEFNFRNIFEQVVKQGIPFN